MKKLFGDLKMTWLSVVLFAVITGVYTGAVLLIPALKNTSFQDIGIYPEWWVIFAVIIIVNCEKGWEAALKCFVFFLISQPLIYLTEILFGSLTFEKARMYYLATWLPMTCLTLPGGFIAHYCKKQNIAGSIILGLGNTIQLAMGLYYLLSAIRAFPHHILSVGVSLASVVVMTVCIQEEKMNRIVALAVPVILVAFIAILSKVTGLVIL